MRARGRSHVTETNTKKHPRDAKAKVIFLASVRYLFMKSYSLLNSRQKRWLKNYCKQYDIRLNIKKLQGVIFLLKSGCQWRMLPSRYGKWKSVYHYFRCISESSWFSRMLKKLLSDRRERLKGKQRRNPHVAIIDSQSSRCGLPQSQKGIDGNKRIKGIKRHIAVDSHGLPLRGADNCMA